MQPADSVPVGPSEVLHGGVAYTTEGRVPNTPNRALTIEEIAGLVENFLCIELSGAGRADREPEPAQAADRRYGVICGRQSASGYWSLMAASVALAFAAAVDVPGANALASLVVPPEQRGRAKAIAIVT